MPDPEPPQNPTFWNAGAELSRFSSALTGLSVEVGAFAGPGVGRSL